MPPERPNVAVFAPGLLVTVTVEAGNEATSKIHFHVGGQGFWIARVIRELGERPVLVAPVGGESGQVLRGLIRSTGLDFSPVSVAGDSSSYVHDRRDGERQEVAVSRSPEFDRHEVDDLYGRLLQHAVSAGVCVVTGLRPGDRLPADFYRRFGKDCEAAGITTVGDLHGEELRSFLEGGRMELLKVSDEDLIEDGLLSDQQVPDRAVVDAVKTSPLSEVGTVVVSRGGSGALAITKDRCLRATPPTFEVVDPAGAGDSMTAALAVELLRGSDRVDGLRMACAAGAANVTRHGLGSAPVDLIGRLERLVEIEEMTTNAE